MVLGSISEWLAGSYWFTVIAYISAILPWTIMSSFDFIGPTWKTVKNTRLAGLRNLVLIFFPMGYVAFYSFVQFNVGEYSEMCASTLASLLAFLGGLRTIWGLWQLHEFRKWVEESIRALDVMGIRFELKNADKSKCNLQAEDLSDLLYVNEMIIGTQLTDGESRCVLKIGNLQILGRTNEDSNVFFQPIVALLHLIAFIISIIGLLVSFFLRKPIPESVRIVPMNGEDFMIRWFTAFAAQGLKTWIDDFNITQNPKEDGANKKSSSLDTFIESGKYFSSELVGSFALHFWHEYGGGKGLSPMLWDSWQVESDISDGRLTKQELLREALQTGLCLPFRNKMVLNEENVSFASYKAFMDDFITELSVKSSYVKEMRSFDITKLEWLIALLHLGRTSIKHGHNTGYKRHPSMPKLLKNLNTLQEQISGENDNETGKIRDEIGLTLSSVPLAKSMVRLASDGNRFVTKVGEMMDIWLSLAAGDQIKFICEDFPFDWQNQLAKINIKLQNDPKILRHFLNENRELEKRRLVGRIADKGHRYGSLDSSVQFMGYRMESVRTALGRYEKSRKMSNLEKHFEDLPNHTETLSIALSGSTQACLLNLKNRESFQRRSVQCQIIFDIQNTLEAMLMEKCDWGEEIPSRTRTTVVVMLMLLSMPGVSIEIQERLPRVKKGQNSVHVSMKKHMTDPYFHNVQLNLKVAYPVQNIWVRLLFEDSRTGSLNLEVSRKDTCFKWEWWRESFLGRLIGHQEWKTEMGMSKGLHHLNTYSKNFMNFQDGNGSIKTVCYESETYGDFKVRFWIKWLPFRYSFFRYEMESHSVLTDRVSVGEEKVLSKDTGKIGYKFGIVPIHEIQEVQYQDACETILVSVQEKIVHSFTEFVQRRVRKTRTDQNLYIVAPPKDEGKCGQDYYLRKKMVRLQDQAECLIPERISEEGYENRRKEKENIAGELLVGCKNLVGSVHLDAENIQEVHEMIIACLAVNTYRFKKPVLQILHQMILFLDEIDETISISYLQLARTLAFVAYRNNDMRSISKSATKKSIWEIVFSMKVLEFYGDRGCVLDKILLQGGNQEGISNDRILRSNCLKLVRGSNGSKILQPESIYATWKSAILKLPNIYEQWLSSEKEIDLRYLFQQIDILATIPLLCHAVSQTSDANAMFRLAVLLEKGEHFLKADFRVAKYMYECAICEANHIGSMNNLAALLESGTKHFGAEPVKAKKLYRRAIDEGNNSSAMINLALLLAMGADGVEQDIEEATKLIYLSLRKDKHHLCGDPSDWSNKPWILVLIHDCGEKGTNALNYIWNDDYDSFTREFPVLLEQWVRVEVNGNGRREVHKEISTLNDNITTKESHVSCSLS